AVEHARHAVALRYRSRSRLSALAEGDHRAAVSLEGGDVGAAEAEPHDGDGEGLPGHGSGLLSRREADGDLALGRRDDDPRVLERGIDRDAESALDDQPILEPIRPAADLEIERA